MKTIDFYAVPRKPANDNDLMQEGIAIQAKTHMYKDNIISDYSVLKFLFKYLKY